MKKTLPLLICLVHLLIPIAVMSQQPSSDSSRKQKTNSRAVDALWISILPSKIDFPPGKYPQSIYFDVQSDGRFVVAEGDDPTILKVVRSGVLPEKLVRRAFQIVNQPAVLNADDTEPGEPIFSDSDWVSVGLMIGGNVKASGGWAYQEEIKDFPAEFRNLVAELKSIAAKLPQATKIKALLSAGVVDAQRVESIGRNKFIGLDEEGLNRLPALKQAILTSRRIIAVEDEAQMSQFAELARRMTSEFPYWGLYKIGEQFYEVGSYYLKPAR